MNPVKSISILAAGVLIAYRISVQAAGSFIFDSVIDVIIYFCSLCLVVFVIRHDARTYRQTKNILSYTPTICFIVMVGFCCSLQYYYYRREHVPVLVYGNYDGDYNGTSIALRNDGTYQVNNYCLGDCFFYGKYTMRDSIVTLDRDLIDNVVTRHLVIRRSETAIIQVDTNGQELTEYDRFRLIKDNRSNK